jgi:hypothetical protein
MLAQPVPLTPEQHKDLRVKPELATEILADRHLAPLMLQEFSTAAAFYPIFFLKTSETAEEYNAVTVFGLKEWTGEYLPANLRSYPFTLVPADNDQLILCINEQSDNVSRTEGNALFTDEGKPTEFLEGINKFFGDFIDANNVSRNVTAQLVEFGLMKPEGLTYHDKAGTERRVQGFYVIDREKFDKLTDEQFLTLRKLGVLAAIYAHFASLERISRLIERLPA